MSPISALTRSEARLVARRPSVLVWLALPALIALAFASVPAARVSREQWGGQSVLEIFHAPLVVMCVILLSLHIMSSDIVGYRENGYLATLQTSPARVRDLLVARANVTFVLQTIGALFTAAVPFLLGALTWEGNVLAVTGSYVALSLSTLSIGMLIAMVASNAQVAMALNMFLVLLLTLLSGIWIPRDIMPGFLRTASDFSPSGAASEGLDRALSGSSISMHPIWVLIVWSLLGGAAALVLAQRSRAHR